MCRFFTGNWKLPKWNQSRVDKKWKYQNISWFHWLISFVERELTLKISVESYRNRYYLSTNQVMEHSCYNHLYVQFILYTRCWHMIFHVSHCKTISDRRMTIGCNNQEQLALSCLSIEEFRSTKIRYFFVQFHERSLSSIAMRETEKGRKSSRLSKCWVSWCDMLQWTSCESDGSPVN